jgi:hypothetical protein
VHIGLKLGLAARRRGGAALSPFLITFTGLTDGEARIGDHASIGYIIDPDNGTETVAWGTVNDDDTYGTGADPTDITAGDGGNLVLSVTDGGETRYISAPIRYAAAVNTVAPVASGDTGLGDTLSVTNGTWTGAAGGDYSYQWQRDGVDIAGATSSTYDIVAADSEADVRCVVTYTNSGGAVSANSNAVTVDTFTAPAFTEAPAYSIDGRDFTITTGMATGNPAPTYSIALTLDGSPVTPTGSGPWTGTVANDPSAQTLAWVVTATNPIDTATSSGSAIIPGVPAAVNPALSLTAQTAGSGGNPPSLSADYNYAGTDTVDLVVVLANTATKGDGILADDGTVGGSAVEDTTYLDISSPLSVNLTGFTDDTVSHIHVVAVERNNGGTSGVQVIAVSGLDFTPLGFTSAEATDANTVEVTMDDTIVGTEDADDWAFDIDGSPATITGVSIASNVVTLTVSDTMTDSDVLDELAYTAGDLTDESGVAMASFTGESITNSVPGAGGIGTPVRLLATPYADSSEGSATHTTATVTPTGGRPLAIVVHMQAGTTSSETPSAATFGGVDVTPHETITNNSRVHTFIYVVENPGTSSQAFSITMPSTPRSIVIEILEVPGAATSSTVGNAMTSVAGTDTSAAVSGTTGTNGSLVLYAMTRRYNAEGISVSGMDGSLSEQTSPETSQYRDVSTRIGWEVVATAGAAAGTFSWSTSDEHAAVGIELKAA